MADNPKVQEIYLMFASQMANLISFIIFAKNAKLDAKSCVWMIPLKMQFLHINKKNRPLIKRKSRNSRNY